MRNPKPATSEKLVSTKELAELLGLSARRIQQLAEDGVLVRAAKGKYKAVDSIQGYIRSLQEREAGTDEVNYYSERALHEKAKREKAEMVLAVMKGELHRAEDVRDVMNNMIAAFRSKIMAIPSKLAPQLVGNSNMVAVQGLLSREVHEALTELSEYDPQVFHEKNQDYVGLMDDEDSE